nr:hypothetical protein [Tanacetum cinerariifolium]
MWNTDSIFSNQRDKPTTPSVSLNYKASGVMLLEVMSSNWHDSSKSNMNKDYKCENHYLGKEFLIVERPHNTPSLRHRAEEGTSKKGSDLDVSAACPEALNQGAAIPSHQGKETRKEKRCSKGWRKVYSTVSGIRGRACPHTRTIQGVSHTIVSTETLKAITRALAQEKRNLLLKNVITKEHPHEGWKRCQKVEVAHEDIESQNQKGKSQVLRMICPNHGIYAQNYQPKLIKHLHDKIPKSVDEMMMVITTFLRGEMAAYSRERMKSFPSWKQQTAGKKQNFKKGGFQNQQRLGKCSKKEGSLGKGQATSNPDGIAIAEDIRTKDHLNLLSRDNDLILTPRGGGWDGGSHNY